MKIIIRQENEKDYRATEKVVEDAFKNATDTDHREHLLVAKLRQADSFIPELSLVAEVNDEIVGHIMLTNILIENEIEQYNTLALAPVSVLPEYQNQGIGSKLVIESLKIAKEIGYESVIVLGHDQYYPRFGFKPASLWGIKPPFEVADAFFMALELKDRALDDITGNVIYSKEFLG